MASGGISFVFTINAALEGDEKHKQSMNQRWDQPGMLVPVSPLALNQHLRSYLMKALARLVVLAPQTVGAAQVEEHHGPRRRHAAGVAQRRLFGCCGTHTHNY